MPIYFFFLVFVALLSYSLATSAINHRKYNKYSGVVNIAVTDDVNVAVCCRCR